MKNTKGKNYCESVVTKPTSANRSMNASVSVSKTPSPANRKMNTAVVVNPK